MPFASSLVGANPSSAAAFEVYWGVNAAVSLAMTVLLIVTSRGGGRLIGGVTFGEWLFRVFQSAGPTIAFAVGIWLAWRGDVALSRFCWVLIFPVAMLVRLFRPRPRPARG